MSNTATISFKIKPDYYTLLRAMAAGEGVSLSEYVRDAVIESKQLEIKAQALSSFFSQDNQKSEHANDSLMPPVTTAQDVTP